MLNRIGFTEATVTHHRRQAPVHRRRLTGRVERDSVGAAGPTVRRAIGTRSVLQTAPKTHVASVVLLMFKQRKQPELRRLSASSCGSKRRQRPGTGETGASPQRSTRSTSRSQSDAGDASAVGPTRQLPQGGRRPRWCPPGLSPRVSISPRTARTRICRTGHLHKVCGRRPDHRDRELLRAALRFDPLPARTQPPGARRR